MSSSINSQANFGSFVPTTNIWDVQQLQALDIDPQLKELLIRLYQNINRLSLSVNTRDAGYYALQEFLCGQVYFPNPALNSTTNQTPTLRQVFRTVINFGTLPNTATKTVAHGIDVTNTYSITRLYAAATNSATTSFIPIPYASASAVANNIELSMDTTNISITTGIDQTAYTKCYVIAEYIKQ